MYFVVVVIIIIIIIMIMIMVIIIQCPNDNENEDHWPRVWIILFICNITTEIRTEHNLEITANEGPWRENNPGKVQPQVPGLLFCFVVKLESRWARVTGAFFFAMLSKIEK
jgi:hypothetical protein